LFKGAPSLARVNFALQDKVNVDEAVKALTGAFAMIPVPHRLEADAKNNSVALFVAVPEDPFALAQQLGLDLQAFVKEASVEIDLGSGLTELLDAGKDATLADLIKAKFDVKLQFRKALVHTLAPALPGKAGLAFAAFLENSNFVTSMGSAKDFLSGVLPPQGLNLNQQMYTQPFLVYLSKAAVFALADSSASTMGSLLKAMVGGPLSEKHVAPIIQALGKYVAQPDQILVHTGSGVKITLNMRGVLPFKTIASLAN